MKGNMLTAHFAVNFVSVLASHGLSLELKANDIYQGLPYEYIVDVDSKGFRDAPPPILRALHRLSWAGKECVTDGSFQKFNELLAIGYMEDQSISVSHVWFQVQLRA